ncbi:MAG: DEAD/DEAH box helicase family protein [Bacteroidota bacterium]|nr:DEAD/DEAH box helicase family protein [Bacteroidota bacterium]
MQQFPKNTKFKYPWRKYQQRILDELKSYLDDNNLHIVAPPGSGKTVLGLEVALQLNQPTLILAPTLAIRNQWIQRFCELFLQTDFPPDWISKDIRNPKFLTVVTYQGLHAACSASKNIEESSEDTTEQRLSEVHFQSIVKKLKQQNIKTIVVDEAHHLKNEWWQTLIKIKNELNPTIVGLTATPPYDVSATEWKRYTDLNGEVDAEISIPELINEDDLCPHQDYIYFSFPTPQESIIIDDIRQKIDHLYLNICSDPTLIDAIQQHPFWTNTEGQLEFIYNNIAQYSSCVIFLNANNIAIPKAQLELIGNPTFEIPPMSYEWMELLLDFYLYSNDIHFQKFETHRIALENQLKNAGVIEKKQINFHYNRRIYNYLTSSISKLESIQNIVDIEYQQLQNKLRMVVLTDYIRSEFLSVDNENKLELNKLGVIPIFEKLRRNNNQHIKIGVLTGSTIIIPQEALADFTKKASQHDISAVSCNPLPYDTNYLLIHQTEQLKAEIIHIITQIFQEGNIEILIGTKALLGEGWDAPAINSLILASTVGSFVLSNQMRGRAIRVQKGNPNKTSNIWHLASINPHSNDGGDDFQILTRRFKGFVGISFRDEVNIENGISRFELPENFADKSLWEATNKKMAASATKRATLQYRWKTAIGKGSELIDQIKIPFKNTKSYKQTKMFYLTNTIRSMTITLTSALLVFFSEILFDFFRIWFKASSIKEFYWFFTTILIIGFCKYGLQSYKSLRIYLKYRDISKDIHLIGKVLVQTLCATKNIHTPIENLRVKSAMDENGAVYSHLEGGTTFEKSLYTNTLHEIVAPINNPRYIIIRKSRFLFFIQQKDFHAVPEILAKNNKTAELLASNWRKLVGNCQLIFTRNTKGRKIILQSRIQSLAAQFQLPAEHINQWK